MPTETIPVFFAADANYLPYLSVAILSMRDNANPDCLLKVHVLHAGPVRGAERLQALSTARCEILFVDVAERLQTLSAQLHMRDYYTCATYYRLFIADLFPEYDKALYIDSDVAVTGDIAELYGHDLGDALAGAIPDETVAAEPIFCAYVREALGIAPERYFNAGVLLLNLRAFRNENFFTQFNTLLGLYKFTVAQDQDYLNVLFRNRVAYLSPEWNKMPVPQPAAPAPKLIHYNLTRKPWHYDTVLYGETFWRYAARSPFFAEICAERQSFTAERARADADCERRLIALAVAETERADNYRRVYGNTDATQQQGEPHGIIA